jgi:hypothetical protein
MTRRIDAAIVDGNLFSRTGEEFDWERGFLRLLLRHAQQRLGRIGCVESRSPRAVERQIEDPEPTPTSRVVPCAAARGEILAPLGPDGEVQPPAAYRQGTLPDTPGLEMPGLEITVARMDNRPRAKTIQESTKASAA